MSGISLITPHNNGVSLIHGPGRLRCYREAMAYSQLRELQGKCIPRSYGFYRVRTQKHVSKTTEPEGVTFPTV